MGEKPPSKLFGFNEIPVAEAHCDGPCGVYDPASARIAAEAVRSMMKKMLDLTPPEFGDTQAAAAYHNTISRYASIKEEQAELAKHELLVLWTDYFKPVHLEAYPDLHEVFWNAAKACSECKQHVSTDVADELMASVEKIHNMFWESKGREVTYYEAS
ncbi:MAG: superoxide dismutase, Ni [Acidimicrobiales bacterium]|nr:superoxide dismutase, Ni [Acidimicrobiales bacterium]MDP6298586.1 superoxide dismutase, Ni [Acidimicrobiales bacterium]HJM29105.1 superoxide dismutase, Ni [Acidimicrobiales bacterium]HJM97421.1 superoxide dismutase, Ni [Acidimicrobiales bacterium]